MIISSSVSSTSSFSSWWMMMVLMFFFLAELSSSSSSSSSPFSPSSNSEVVVVEDYSSRTTSQHVPSIPIQEEMIQSKMMMMKQIMKKKETTTTMARTTTMATTSSTMQGRRRSVVNGNIDPNYDYYYHHHQQQHDHHHPHHHVDLLVSSSNNRWLKTKSKPKENSRNPIMKPKKSFKKKKKKMKQSNNEDNDKHPMSNGSSQKSTAKKTTTTTSSSNTTTNHMKNKTKKKKKKKNTIKTLQNIFLLGECEGNCSNDQDCQGDLVCTLESSSSCDSFRGSDSSHGGSVCCHRVNGGRNYFRSSEFPPSSSSPSSVTTNTTTTTTTTPCGPSSRYSNSSEPSSSPTSISSLSPTEFPSTRDIPIGEGGNNGQPPLTYVVVDQKIKLDECQGPCINSNDCNWGLNCFLRSSTHPLEPVPGCDGYGMSGVNYCYIPPPGVAVLMGNNRRPRSVFPLGWCQADCDNDKDCDWGLECQQRINDEDIIGCSGLGLSTEDYCIRRPDGYLRYNGDNGYPSSHFPLGNCEGDCDGDHQCQPGLLCFQRRGTQAVPGCLGDGISGKDYCYNPNPQDIQTTPAPTQNEDAGSRTTPPVVVGVPTLPPGTITYIPGDLTVIEAGLLLSTGLTAKVLASMDEFVSLHTGGISTERFHRFPDGAGIFKNEATGGWAYVSNAESSSNGGVGALYFDVNGHVIDYQRLLSGTRSNCGGGKTFWNTWLTCEEDDGGQVWEVDPWANPHTGRETLLGGMTGSEYESAAYDNRDPYHPTFYITTDLSDGPLVRYTPATAAIDIAVRTGDFSNLLHTVGEGMMYEYLVIDDSINSNGGVGTFSWTTNIEVGKASAWDYFRNAEGIDIRNGILYFTSKTDKLLWILDLDNGTVQRTSTVSGAFDSEPDQVARILATDGTTDGILYFCEDAREESGVHGRDERGVFFTILTDNGYYGGETTGLAFSPDGMFMYVSYQSPGLIFEIKRRDGLPFQGQRLDIKYHAVDGY